MIMGGVPPKETLMGFLETLLDPKARKEAIDEFYVAMKSAQEASQGLADAQRAIEEGKKAIAASAAQNAKDTRLLQETVDALDLEKVGFEAYRTKTWAELDSRDGKLSSLKSALDTRSEALAQRELLLSSREGEVKAREDTIEPRWNELVEAEAALHASMIELEEKANKVKALFGN